MGRWRLGVLVHLNALRKIHITMKITATAFILYSVSDIDRSKDFYERILGLAKGEWDLEIEPGVTWTEYEVCGCTFAISNAEKPAQPSGGKGIPLVAFEVDDLDAALGHLQRENVSIVAEPVDTGVCRFMEIADPDGNRLLIHQRHPKFMST